MGTPLKYTGDEPAFRAAKALVESILVIVRDKNSKEEIEFIAEVIDRETGVKEMVEALQEIADGKLYGGAGESYGRLLACQRIAKQALRNTERKR